MEMHEVAQEQGVEQYVEVGVARVINGESPRDVFADIVRNLKRDGHDVESAECIGILFGVKLLEVRRNEIVVVDDIIEDVFDGSDETKVDEQGADPNKSVVSGDGLDTLCKSMHMEVDAEAADAFETRSVSGSETTVEITKPVTPNVTKLSIGEIVVKSEYQAHWGANSDEINAAIETKIKREGYKDRLTVWRRNGVWTLLDGHNRLPMLQRLGYDVIDVYADPDGVINDASALKWIDKYQRDRRNATPEQLAQRAYSLNEMFKAERNHDPRRNLKRGDNLPVVQIMDSRETSAGSGYQDAESPVVQNLVSREKSKTSLGQVAKELNVSRAKAGELVAEHKRKLEGKPPKPPKAGKPAVKAETTTEAIYIAHLTEAIRLVRGCDVEYQKVMETEDKKRDKRMAKLVDALNEAVDALDKKIIRY